MRFIAGLILIAVAWPAFAAAPDASRRPLVRGAAQQAHEALIRPNVRPEGRTVTSGDIALPERVRPAMRPQSEQDKYAAQVASVDGAMLLAASAAATLPQSSRPILRPQGLAEKVMAKRRKERRAAKRGAVCGDVSIQGETIGTVPGRIRGCGVKNAVRIRSVAGVKLTQGSVMNCATAKALKTWVNSGVKPAIGNRGGGVSSLKVAAHYACRTRNNQKGARISEHGKGRAIDISAINLQDGSSITVLKGWRTTRDGKALKKMWKAACGPFGTVLGPNANRFHQDHFHFDTASYRSGSYCR